MSFMSNIRMRNDERLTKELIKAMVITAVSKSGSRNCSFRYYISGDGG